MEDLKKLIESLITLEPGAWESMVSCLEERTVSRKEYFLHQGEVCIQIGFIRKGYVRLFYSDKNSETTKDFNFENSFCGSHASFSTQQPARFNIIAMEDCELYVIDRPQLYALYDRYKCFERLGRLQMEYMFDRKEQREAAFLLDDAEKRYADLLRSYPQIQQRVPLKYIASYLGITAETLSRMRALRWG